MITINNLTFLFGAKLLFAEVNLILNKGNRYGLVGANGAGKTTLMKLLAKEEEPSSGEINIAKRAKIGWLKQDQFKYENVSIINTVIAGKQELWNAICEKENILSHDQISDEMGYRIGDLEQIIIDNDGYNAEYIASELLVGLGIKEELHYEPLSILSGGYKLRVLLAQSLFENPDILLLDEPTNHLDISSIYWLENYLKNEFNGLLIFISHDLAFLNNVSTHILDIDYGEILQYTGNYQSFEIQKQAIMEQKLKDLQFAEKKIAHMRVFIEKFRATASRSKQALSREKLIDKIELPDIKRSSRISPNFNFSQSRPSGKMVLKVNGIHKSFEEKKILNNVNFSIMRGEKVIIIGPNGVGKSSLLKIITGNTKPDSGSYEFGHEVKCSYFAQDHHELLNESMPAYSWLEDKFPEETQNRIRSILGQILFSQDEANKDILQISGGEGARLLLGKIMLEKGNFLVLDEPTNHLDIESKNALKEALINFPGTLLLVTHDRDFASAIATRIIAINHRKVTDFNGTYDEYLKEIGQDYFRD